MKALGLFFVLISMIALVGCTPNTGANSNIDSAQSITWSFADAGGTAPLNRDSSKSGVKPVLVEFDGSLYAAWLEDNGTVDQVRVKATADGTSWTFVDGGGVNGLNIDPTLAATGPALAASDSKIYVAWTEDPGTSTPQVRVKESADGTTWTSIESGGINVSSSDTALDVRLVYFSNNLYAVWKEYNGTEFQIRVKRHDGGTAWTLVDGGSLNKSTSHVGEDPFPLVYNNTLYVTWSEVDATNGKYQIRVKSYDGTSWSFVDGGGVTGLNHDTTQDASYPKMAVYNSKLFLAFGESDGTASQIRVKSFDGTTWASEDGAGTTGINVSTTKGAGAPFLIVFNSRLVAIWNETDGAKDQIRVKAYDGATWTSEDGGGATGLNSDASHTSYLAWAYVFEAKLYVVWHEYFTPYNVMVKAGS